MTEQERIYLVVDKCDNDGGTEIELVDAPAYSTEDRYVDGVRRILDGLVIMAVKEHTILCNDVTYTRKLEAIMKDKRREFVKWLKDDAKRLREVKLYGDKAKGELNFNCLENRRYEIIQILKRLPTWIELIKITNKFTRN